MARWKAPEMIDTRDNDVLLKLDALKDDKEGCIEALRDPVGVYEGQATKTARSSPPQMLEMADIEEGATLKPALLETDKEGSSKTSGDPDDEVEGEANKMVDLKAQ